MKTIEEQKKFTMFELWGVPDPLIIIQLLSDTYQHISTKSCIQNHVKHLSRTFFAKIVNSFLPSILMLQKVVLFFEK